MPQHLAGHQPFQHRQRIGIGQLDLMPRRIGHRVPDRETVFLQMGQDLVVDVVAADQAFLGVVLGGLCVEAVTLKRVIMYPCSVVGDCRYVIDHGGSGRQASAQ